MIDSSSPVPRIPAQMHDCHYLKHIGFDTEQNTEGKDFRQATPNITFDYLEEFWIEFDSIDCILNSCKKTSTKTGLL